MVHAAVIEVLGRDAQVRQTFKLAAGLVRIGRSPDCDVVLADPHMAAAHAELSFDELGQAQLKLLPSVNGGRLGAQRLEPGSELAWPAGAHLQLGGSLLRLRSSAEPLAEERPLLDGLGARSGSAWPAVAVLSLVWAMLLAYDQWANLDPGARWTDFVGPVFWPLGLVAAWAALWALVTQLFQHWFPFAAHLKRTLAVVLGLHLLGMGLPVLAYALSWSRLMVIDALAFPAGLAALLWWQASAVWPRARRALAGTALALFALGMALMAAKRSEQQHWFGPAYLSQLPPPQLRLVAPKTPEQLIDALRPLEAELARQASKENDKPSLDGNSD